MKVLGLIGLSFVLVASLSTPAMAEGPKDHKGEKHEDAFKKADANGDGKLSLDEFKTLVKKDAEVKFAAADTDKDGFVTPAEFKAWRASEHAARKAAKDAAKDAPPAPVAPAAVAPVVPATK